MLFALAIVAHFKQLYARIFTQFTELTSSGRILLGIFCTVAAEVMLLERTLIHYFLRSLARRCAPLCKVSRLLFLLLSLLEIIKLQ